MENKIYFMILYIKIGVRKFREDSYICINSINVYICMY